jgi:outer membrane immunogenic protein
MWRYAVPAAILGLSAIPAAASDYKSTSPSWQGPYIGLHVGGGRSNIDWTYVAGGNAADHSGSGAFAGGQVGYNFRAGDLVVGVEADISAAGIDGGTSCPNPAFTCDSDISMLGSVRLRAGVTTGGLLIYGTGGFGFGRIDISTTSAVIGTNGTKSNESGWVAGGGLEFALDRYWSVKGEYLYFDLGSSTYIVDNNLRVRADTIIHTGKIGLNYRF